MQAQAVQGIGGVTGAEPAFDGGDADARMGGYRPGTCKALGQRRHAVAVFQRVLRADQPPDLVEFQAVQGRQADFAMRRMGGRSEEHTSELQSLMRISYAVFCLKKKKTPNN